MVAIPHVPDPVAESILREALGHTPPPPVTPPAAPLRF